MSIPSTTVHVHKHIGEVTVLYEVQPVSLTFDGTSWGLSMHAIGMKTEWLGQAPPLWFWDGVGA